MQNLRNPYNLKLYLSNVFEASRAHWKSIAVAAFFATTAASIAQLSREPQFTSSAVVMMSTSTGENLSLFEEAGSRQSAFPQSDLMGSFFSSYLVPSVLGSKAVSEAVLANLYTYSFEGKQRSTNLYEFLEMNNKDAAIVKLKSTIAAFYLDPSTGSTRIIITTSLPELSYQIAKAYIESVDEALNKLQLNSIKDNLRCLDLKIKANSLELSGCEQSLKLLREKNRDYKIISDPEFYLQKLQLEREIKIHEDMEMSLKSYYELTMSRLKNRGSKLTVISEPSISSNIAYPRTMSAVMRSLLIGVLTAILLAMGYSQNPLLSSEWQNLLISLKHECFGDYEFFRSRAIAKLKGRVSWITGIFNIKA